MTTDMTMPNARSAVLKTIFYGAVAAGLALSHGTAFASARAEAGTSGGVRWALKAYNQDEVKTSIGAATATASVSAGETVYPFGGGPATSNGSARAIARDGVLRVFTENDVAISHFPNMTGNYNGGNGQSEATATWNDSITFYDAKLPIFSPVILHGGFRISGSVTSSAGTLLSDGLAGMLLYGTGIGAGPNSFGGCSHGWCEYSVNGNAPPGQTTFSYIPTTISIRNGQTIGLSYLMTAGDQASVCCLVGNSPDTSYIATADFSHTLAWAGINSVTDGNGAALTGYSLLSQDGFDYLKSAVPEPSAYAMMIVGFGLLGHAARRRERRRSLA